MSFDLHDAILSITKGQEEDSSHHAVAAALYSLISSALCSLLSVAVAAAHCMLVLWRASSGERLI